MDIRKIIHFWENGKINKQNSDILRNPCSEVIFPLDKKTRKEIDDLIDTFVSDEQSVGLAAPQIGVRKRFFVFDPKYPETKKKTRQTVTVIINPKTVPSTNDLTWLQIARPDTLTSDFEGCLSLPGINAQVPRLKEIKIKGYSINGKRISKKFEGFPARVIQHEMDHLLGRMIIDYDERIYAEDSRASVISELLNKVKIG